MFHVKSLKADSHLGHHGLMFFINTLTSKDELYVRYKKSGVPGFLAPCSVGVRLKPHCAVCGCIRRSTVK